MVFRSIRRLGHLGKDILILSFLFCRGWIASLIKRPKRREEEYPIDFVVTWVDDGDPEWIGEKRKYSGQITEQASNTEARYRNWETLVYWFRAVEKYAPWVNRVYLVSCGHKPPWLNLQSEKLRFVAHGDFMPKAYLPTFSSRPIELNMWRIPGLSEHFVYFNDDMFLNRPVKPEDFFADGLPRECAIAKPLYVTNAGKGSDASLAWRRSLLNDYSVINGSFNIRECIRRSPEKWFSYANGLNARFNLRLYSDGYVAGMVYPHVSRAFLKKDFVDLWEKQGRTLDETSKSRFRSASNVTIQLATLWMLFSGDFYPSRKEQLGKYYNVHSISIERITEELLFPKHNVICVNDGDKTEDSEFEGFRQIILEAFSKKLPEKSSFEL